MRIFAVNLNSPSETRARLQVERLLAVEAEILVLTELKFGAGANLIVRELRSVGYSIFGWSNYKFDGFASIVASRIEGSELSAAEPGRICTVRLQTDPELLLIAAYGPSTDPFGRSAPNKVDTKRRWLQEFVELLADRSQAKIPFIAVGDLNIVDDRDLPQYRQLYNFERQAYKRMTSLDLIDVLYDDTTPTWVSPTGSGFRFDYALISTDALDTVVRSTYLHQWRSRNDGLTDHSGIELELNADCSHAPPQELPVGTQTSLF